MTYIPPDDNSIFVPPKRRGPVVSFCRSPIRVKRGKPKRWAERTEAEKHEMSREECKGMLPANYLKPDKTERLWNKCKKCNCSTRGKVRRWPNKKVYWECPRCWHAQGYPR